MNSILVSGSLAYDHIMNFPDLFKNHFLPEKLHNINVSFNVGQHAQYFGGTAGNIAYTLALLGEKPAIIATAGNDFNTYEQHLIAAGVDLSLVKYDQNNPCSFAYILTDQADNQITAFYPGAGGNRYAGILPQAKLALVSPSCPPDMEAFPEIFKKQNTPVFFDPGQVIPALSRKGLQSGITNADVVFANDYEFSAMCNTTGWSEADMLEHGKTFVVTLGGQGTRVLSQNGGYKIPAVLVENPVDPTGAGDAYRAGYAKGFIAGLAVELCVKLGSCAAAYAVETLGTQNHHFTMQEFRARYQSAYSEKCPV